MRFSRVISVLALVFAVSPGAGAHGPRRVPEPAPPEPALQGARLFRGMNERQLPLDRVRAILRGERGIYVPSHRFSTLKASGMRDSEAAERIDADVAFWRERGELRELAYCHADPYECLMPGERTLRAVSLREPSLWAALAGLFPVTTYESKLRALKPFDPVISTSVSREVARLFARTEVDESGRVYKGYVLELRDVEGRHCPLELQRRERCLVRTDEYGDEYEYPFYGYIRPDEVVALEVDGIRWVRRH